MCDLHAQIVAETRSKIANELIKDNDGSKQNLDKFILVSTAIGKSYFANLETVSDYFKSENEYLDFCHSFEKDFVSAWQAKNARNKLMPLGMKRVRISGLGNLTKRNGFRVVASEVITDDTSEAFKFFHILRIDEKLDKFISAVDKKYAEKQALDELKSKINWATTTAITSLVSFVFFLIKYIFF
jgi:hypothetical protein